MIESKHWMELLAQRIVDERKPPFLVTAGMTTSGPFHMGTLCEMLFPHAIGRYLANQGHKTRFIFFADILDAFDSVPTSMQQYIGLLAPHLGKPLCDVPDPYEKTNSFGEYFLEEARGIGEKFGIHPEIKKINELYKQGLFDDYARLYLRESSKSAGIVARTSLRDSLPDWWNPVMPICENCGRIATTRVTEFDENTYSYVDDRDVGYTKGCGHAGSNKISNHKYKLTWRLHWPSWMQIFGPSSVEGAGVDHHTRGGSWDTVVAVHEELLNKQPPIPYKFGFVLLQGKKYSKSKGIGMGVSDLT
ncbi:MAG: lysine--tRNA ligase, partial [Candidatus Micrarchaeota archaeon]|nr:lysine--tRNA ligase [Candidatus Micrarchaeota archaeon]